MWLLPPVGTYQAVVLMRAAAVPRVLLHAWKWKVRIYNMWTLWRVFHPQALRRYLYLLLRYHSWKKSLRKKKHLGKVKCSGGTVGKIRKCSSMIDDAAPAERHRSLGGTIREVTQEGGCDNSPSLAWPSQSHTHITWKIYTHGTWTQHLWREPKEVSSVEQLDPMHLIFIFVLVDCW